MGFVIFRHKKFRTTQEKLISTENTQQTECATFLLYLMEKLKYFIIKLYKKKSNFYSLNLNFRGTLTRVAGTT